jgi:hypothetical protein
MIRKQHSTKPERRKQQISSNRIEQNGSHTEETRVPFHIPPNIEAEQENGKEWNKRIRWNQQDMKESLWCFMYIKEKTLGKNN